MNLPSVLEERGRPGVRGEAFLAQAVHALGSSPAWRQTMLIVTYDEHGGYYDHVPPPAALAPDSVGPVVQPGESTYDGYTRYGFRVPSIVVSPYAKRDYVSHVVYDHTSILAFLERKWNLAAMTYRDANANNLTDFLDLGAMEAHQPTFPELPPLAAAGMNATTLACEETGAPSRSPRGGAPLPAPLGPRRAKGAPARPRSRPTTWPLRSRGSPGSSHPAAAGHPGALDASSARPAEPSGPRANMCSCSPFRRLRSGQLRAPVRLDAPPSC
ncbi:MAG: alkaline phosphatase family protein [Solirubrobacteraceae bacterium]